MAAITLTKACELLPVNLINLASKKTPLDKLDREMLILAADVIRRFPTRTPISGDTHTLSAETTQGGVGNAVRCIETGKIYDSQRQACIDLDLTQAALSQHLNRRTGYKTVRGHTFEKVST